MSYLGASWGVARRVLVRLVTTPALLLPLLLFPLLLFAAFAGGLQRIARTPGFDYFNYTAFQFGYILIQAAANVGVLVGVSVAQDFDSKFVRRMMLSTRNRSVVVTGTLMASLVQSLTVSAILWVIALLAGMEVAGNAPDIAALMAFTLLVNAAAALWSVGVAFRARTISAAPLMQIPVLVPLFFAPVFTTRALLTDWLHDVASYNPVTTLVESSRGFLAGDPVSVGPAVAILTGMILLFGAWTLSGLRRAERGV